MSRRLVPALPLVLFLSFALAAAPAALVADASAAAPLEAPASNAGWARTLVAAMPQATAVNDGDGDKLFDELEDAFADALPHERVPVVVSFVQHVSTQDGLAKARAVAPDAPVERAFRIVPAYAGSLRLDEAIALARLPEVRQIELDSPGAPELDTATLFMGADAVVDAMGVTGSLDGEVGTISAADVAIAVLDTGYHGEHQDLADGKIVRFVDLAEGKNEKPYDPNGHGTHVASIAAGWGRDESMRGVAPGAGIVGLKISGGGGSAESHAIAGYEWVVEHKDELNIRVATMSFGFGIATDGTTALERAVDAAWDAGIVTFKSNGNSGPGRSTMTVPAAARGILGVGAMLDPAGVTSGTLAPATGGDYGFRLSTFSSRGPTSDGRIKPDLAAPGQSIMAAESGTKDGYVSLSGTSMASPFAAGAAALVIAANPALTPDEVREVLVATAEDWGVAGPDIDYGHGRIQVREAVRLALARGGFPVPASEAPPVPFHEVQAGVVQAPYHEGVFVVNDTAHPLAATFIGEGTLLAAQVFPAALVPAAPDAVDDVVGRPSIGVPGRQIVVAFQPQEAGEYRYRVFAPPGTAFVVDLSHGTADAGLLAALPDVESVRPAGGVLPAADDGSLAIPGPGAVALLAGLAGAALVWGRRRA